MTLASVTSLHSFMILAQILLEARSLILVIGTMYRNYHRPALIITFIFPDFLPKILRTTSQERACLRRTYACLTKRYSNSQ